MQEKEKKIYYDIIVRCWKIFSKEREVDEFYDEWWQEILLEADNTAKEFEGTEYYDFVNDLLVKFIGEHHRRYIKWKMKQL